MRRRITLLVAVVAAAVTLAALPAQAGSAPGAYIVVLKDAVDPAAVASIHSNRFGARVDAVWGAALHGYAAVIPNDRVAELRADVNVKYVVADGEASIAAQTIPYGIDLVDADVSSTRAGDGSGAVSNTNVYVIDTGVDTSHPDLNVVEFVNFVKGGGGRNTTDCNGHGTHVAGTIAAKDDTNGVVGVAPGAPVHAVRVLNCQGSGQWSWIISGINWVTSNHGANAVANMSLGGGANQAVDDAVRNSVASGVFYAVSAGNSSTDACTQSPARAGTTDGIMTVGAIDSASRAASFSNYGACVDIWAPGVNVLSTWTGGGYNTISGTSMASPHVTGGGALYRSRNSTSAAGVEAALKSAAVSTGASSHGFPITRENVGGF